ncbi:RPS24B [Symbiodinium sp. KB8]|nr:RPS24B [Symbiodinium sp. KB8]
MAPVKRSAVQEGLAEVNPIQVFVFGFRTKFGGGQSTGFGLIYDSLDNSVEGVTEKPIEMKRKPKKDAKRKKRKTWGTGKRQEARAAKKAAA